MLIHRTDKCSLYFIEKKNNLHSTILVTGPSHPTAHDLHDYKFK